MTEVADNPSRVWTPEGFRDDGWRHAEGAEALEGNGGVILPLAVWKALDPAVREAEKDRIGVLIAPGEDIAEIADALASIPLVALAFPAFNDGRSFSKATLLRSRHGYEGEIRACGDVLIDLIPHMLRTGFDVLEVSNETALARLAEGRIGGLPLYYQPSARPADAGQRYSWRRKPAA
ncbi:DUF934 domain-containing protein [Mesorhizobium xinjiangense]|uniref:DUF934 domain-containing protein n=1 Tax=Mesorhizobium xinjiangense TaxID=2678685 RepID=UPI0012EE8827|nr:DUF934 domain-containing protein [Mesorhizobium xinjiangense]